MRSCPAVYLTPAPRYASCPPEAKQINRPGSQSINNQLFHIHIGACNRLSRGAKAMTASALLCPSLPSACLQSGQPRYRLLAHAFAHLFANPQHRRMVNFSFAITTRPRKATSFNAWRIAVTAGHQFYFCRHIRFAARQPTLLFRNAK